MYFFEIIKINGINFNNNFKVFFKNNICININLIFIKNKLINTDLIIIANININ